MMLTWITADFFLSQALAAVAWVFGMISFQCKSRRYILLCMSACSTANSCHFFVLREPCAATLFLLLGVRSLVAAFSVNRKLMYLFLGLTPVAFVLSLTVDSLQAAELLPHKNPLGFLALFATLLSTCGAFQKTDQRIRLIFMMCAITWVVHNVLVKTPVAVLMEASFLASNLAGYWRFYRGKKSGRADGIREG